MAAEPEVQHKVFKIESLKENLQEVVEIKEIYTQVCKYLITPLYTKY